MVILHQRLKLSEESGSPCLKGSWDLCSSKGTQNCRVCEKRKKFNKCRIMRNMWESLFSTIKFTKPNCWNMLIFEWGDETLCTKTYGEWEKILFLINVMKHRDGLHARNDCSQAGNSQNIMWCNVNTKLQCLQETIFLEKEIQHTPSTVS